MRALDDKLRWERDGRDWPNRESSQFVQAADLTWHLQKTGQGPNLLLLHGTGAATHSWRGLLPLLSRSYTVFAMDLPGHGFTDTPPQHRLSMSGMAGSISSLLDECGFLPDYVIGHSAGAAIAIRLTLDKAISPRHIIGLNAALLPFKGLAGRLFSPLAKFLATSSFAPNLFAARASNKQVVRRLLAETGSRIGDDYVNDYWRLIRSPGHCAAALAMMANWELEGFLSELENLGVPLTLLAGTSDRTVSPLSAYKAVKIAKQAKVVRVAGLGHLAHEEAPDVIFSHITEEFQRVGREDKPE